MSAVMKTNKNKIRTVDEEGYVRRVAVVCHRPNDEVLLITAKKTQEKWIVPGGGVDPGEEQKTAAAREAREEAGVVGDLGQSLGVVQSSAKKERTEIFLMSVREELEHWEESLENNRSRKWFHVDVAHEKLYSNRQDQCQYLELYRKHVTKQE